GDSACFTATASGWGALTYSWDLDGDGTDDTTTTENTICHKYEEADTYWVKVKIEDEMGCEAEDSVEVIIIKDIYIFRVLLTEEDWEGTGIKISGLQVDDSGKIWLTGTHRSESTSCYIRMDTLGHVDSLYNPTDEHFLDVRQDHLIEKYETDLGLDTFISQGSRGDTLYFPNREFDSLKVTPLYSSYPPWVYLEEFICPRIIGGNGWAFVWLRKSERKDSLYPGWEYALTKDGEPQYRIDLPSGYYTGSFAGQYLAIQYGPNSDYTNLIVYDTMGTELFTKSILDYKHLRFGLDGEKGIQKRYTLQPDGTVFYLDGPVENLTLVKADQYNEYRFSIPYVESADILIVGNWHANESNLLLYTLVVNEEETTRYLYFFNIEDTLELLWVQNTEIITEKIGFLNDSNVYIIGGLSGDIFTGNLEVYSRSNGSLLSSWPPKPLHLHCWPTYCCENDIILFDGCQAIEDYSAKVVLLKIEGGE
ncbi:hypothetical protein DRQ36_10010, partial [bacterium]